MLTNLKIKNFALIDTLEIDFESGLNIITGETGAGKSIIIDALMLLLGERASTELIRQGESKAIIEGIFKINTNQPVFSLLRENDFDTDSDEIIVHREILAKGTSRCFLNDTPIQVGILKQIGDLLVDFHGQHDHQLLLRNESHIDILDSIAKNSVQLNEFAEIYNLLLKKIDFLKGLIKKEKSLKDKEESERFELNEIIKIAPQPNEEEKLEEDLKIIENSEILYRTSSELYTLLFEGENNVHDNLTTAGKILEQLSSIDKNFSEFLAECLSTKVTINEIAKFAQDYKSNIEFDPEKIESLRERILLLKGLRKKYGTHQAIFDKQKELEQNLSLIENFEDEIKKLKNEILALKKKAGAQALALSEKRKAAAKKMEKNIVETLAQLGIPDAAFRVVLSCEDAGKSDSHTRNEELTAIVAHNEYKINIKGIDYVEFFISTNKGEIPKPLSSVASGGEVSRVMLAIKSIVAESDLLPMLIFDEIDIGISGRIAQKVGMTMKKLSDYHQIIAITHLPQIAALGDRNISVEKIESNGRTIIQAARLKGDAKLKEIAKLISGEKISDAALKSAKELLKGS